MQFIRTIINDFGGDPQAITLLGWDTGAALVNLLMSSPISAPADSRLFKRTILLGGSALSSWATVKNPADQFYYLAESVGCPTAVKNDVNKNEILSVQVKNAILLSIKTLICLRFPYRIFRTVFELVR